MNDYTDEQRKLIQKELFETRRFLNVSIESLKKLPYPMTSYEKGCIKGLESAIDIVNARIERLWHESQ